MRAVEAVRQENRPGSMAASRPVRHGDSMVPAAQEHASPIRSRADQTTQAIRDALSRVAAEYSGCVSSRRRSKLRIVRFRIHAKAHSLRCSYSPNRTRYAGLRFGFGTGDRVLPHTAFVLTWFKIKKRQASATGVLRTLECFCCKRFRLCE